MYRSGTSSLLRNRRIGNPSGDRSAQQKRAREARETQRQFEVSSRQFTCVRIVGKGAYGVVCEAIDKTERDRTKQRVAIKKIKEAMFHPLDAKLVLRELKLSRLLSTHPNVMGIRTLIKPMSRRKMDTIYVVSDFMDTDLYRLCQSRVELTDKHIRHLMFQTLSGMKFLHSANVLHRDMKTANLLVDRHFNLKICDFGLARFVRPGETLAGSELDQKEDNLNGPPLTELVVTLWYRAPELVANSNYDAAIDIWAVGCIFAEMLLRRPVFPGKDHLHQLQLITDVMGTPTEEDVRSIRGAYARRVLRSLPYRPAKPLDRVFGGAHSQAIDLMETLLVFDSTKRATASEALAHPYFDSVRSSSGELTMATSIEHEFEFDLETDPQLVPMRQKIYDEIMLYHNGGLEKNNSSRNKSSSRSRGSSSSRGRSASRSPNAEQLSSTTSSAASILSSSSSSSSITIDSKRQDAKDVINENVTENNNGTTTTGRGRSRGKSTASKNNRSRSNSRTRSASRDKRREDNRKASNTTVTTTASSSSASVVSTSTKKKSKETMSVVATTIATSETSEAAFNASNGFKPIEEKSNVAILPQKIIHKSKRPVITASNSILSNRTHTRNAKETAVPPPAPPSGIAPHMNAISTTSMPKTTTSERKNSVQTPPRYNASTMKHVPRTASPPRPPSANNGERPPSAGGVIPMVGLLPPPITTTMEGASSSSSSVTREKTYAHASPKRRRMPPPRNRQAGGALMLESEQTFVEKNENVEKKNGKDSVSPTNTTSESIDVAVEKAQSSSSDLLNDLRYRREKGRVKARVKDASAALDAALATSTFTTSTSSTSNLMQQKQSQKTQKIKNTITFSSTSTNKNKIKQEFKSKPEPESKPERLFERLKTTKTVTNRTSAGLARTVSSPAKINNVASSVMPTPDKMITRNYTSSSSRQPSAITSETTYHNNYTTNNTIANNTTANTIANSRPSTTASTSRNNTNKRFVKSNSSTTTRLERVGTTRSTRSTRNNRREPNERPSTTSNTISYAKYSKENLPNTGTNDETTKSRIKKRATVPRPFTFTSRRKAKATPKHIRNQRDALARRRAREQGKGTRQTRFF